MPIPVPRPGLVIGYAYLWQEEHRQGQTEGTKDRPCVLVLTTETMDGDTIVTVAPVTRAEPNDGTTAVEIPATTKHRLGLDIECSWVVVHEVNRFVWAGPDLRPVSRASPGQFAYGMLPPALFERITGRLVACARQRRTAVIVRK